MMKNKWVFFVLGVVVAFLASRYGANNPSSKIGGWLHNLFH